MPVHPALKNHHSLKIVTGPTNTGKTHLAIERMLAHKSGMIGLPLRLLAREVYDRITRSIAPRYVSLVTGEERIMAKEERYRICTVEALPRHTDYAFVAIDEVQLATHWERGHIFTDRLLHLRGSEETMLMGSSTIRPLLEELFPRAEFISKPRFSTLSWSGSKKLTRLPPRTAIVAFSVDEVYAIAELLRRQRGGVAVVSGSLSPRTRNAQVALYESGEVEFLVATDAIGMGLNLDLNHVAFAQDRKFDGQQYRRLQASEIAQIAGRAGRYTRDGTFGVTAQVSGFDEEMIDAIQNHEFQPDRNLLWRNPEPDFSSLPGLLKSLDAPPPRTVFAKPVPGADLRALDSFSTNPAIRSLCTTPKAIKLAWRVCAIPDYRKISPAEHAEILGRVFTDISQLDHIDHDWFAQQVALTDKPDGAIDALSARIAHIRTWTYLANCENWLKENRYWQQKTRHIEDKLSDALHKALTDRFVDRRTSRLMKRLRENTKMEASINDNGDICIEEYVIGNLQGFRFTADASGHGRDAKAANAAAAKVLNEEFIKRANRLCAAANSDFILSNDGQIRWLGAVIARLVPSENVLAPEISLLADEPLSQADRERIQSRIQRWLLNHIENLLRPLIELSRDTTLPSQARGLAFQLSEQMGILERKAIADQIKQMDQDARATLRKHGVRFGAFHIFLPALLKPAPIAIICLLWAVKHQRLDAPGLAEIPQLAASGRTSIQVDPTFDKEIYRLSGFRILGERAVRIDILERLADLIRTALAWKPGSDAPKPEGAHDGSGFVVTPAMMSILGATHDNIQTILKQLGYHNRPIPISEIQPVSEPDKASENQPANADASQDAPKETTPKDETRDQGDNQDDKPEQIQASIPNKADAQPPAEKGETVREAEKPTTALLWFRKRPNAQRTRNAKSSHHHPGANRGKSGAGKKHTHAKSSKGQSKYSPRDRAPRQQKIDPDSPFAKLAALKETIASNND